MKGLKPSHKEPAPHSFFPNNDSKCLVYMSFDFPFFDILIHLLAIMLLSLELQHSTHKQETFAEIWETANYNDKPVTRIEYQLRRKLLKRLAGQPLLGRLF